MKVLNYGSLNIDHVYGVDHFVQAKETMSSNTYEKFCGGKGLNQSVALGCAGMEVYHAGKVGIEGQFLIDMLNSKNVNTDLIRMTDGASGHAIIQVDAAGQNCIMLYGGANQEVTKQEIDQNLSNFDKGDYLVLQNEINNNDYIIEKAFKKQMYIVLNPAPMNEKVRKLPLDKVSMFIINEVEGEQLTGKSNENEILDSCSKLFPKTKIVLTLGEKGVWYSYKQTRIFQQAFVVKNVMDTTAAGDTFIGFFLSSIAKEYDISKSLEIACKASSICVSRSGASISIPMIEEVITELENQ